jgi:hypothetical protein
MMKLLIMKFSPLPCYLVSLRLKYSHQNRIHTHPQPAFLPQCQRPSFTPIQNNMQIKENVVYKINKRSVAGLVTPCVVTAF